MVLRDVSVSAVVTGFLSALIDFACQFWVVLEATRAAVVEYTGWFRRLLSQAPNPVLQSLLAGILLPFVVTAAGAFTKRSADRGQHGGRLRPREALLRPLRRVPGLLRGCVVSLAHAESGTRSLGRRPP